VNFHYHKATSFDEIGFALIAVVVEKNVREVNLFDLKCFLSIHRV
jgi:hypothetical protein